MAVTTDAQAWAEEQFGQCDLKDERRTRRLVDVAAEVLCHPSGSLPEQAVNMADLKAAYRLFACKNKEVKFESIAGPHWEQTRQRPSGTYLVVSDTTELDFGIRRTIAGMAQTGNGGGWGFLLHSALVVSTEGEVIGLAGQKIHYRKAAPKKENTAQRLKRDRESRIWGEVIDLVGPPAEGIHWVHVMDRAADNFEVYCHCWEQHSDWVVRVTQQERNIEVPDGKTVPLSAYLSTLPLAGTYELQLRARPAQPKRGHQPARKARSARTARLEVHYGPLHMPVPREKSPYVKRLSPPALAMWVVHAVEVDTPKDQDPIEWILLTSLPVQNFDDAWQILSHYEKRWLVEEWHKALKTGCRVECRQLKSKEGLERIVGLHSVVAVRLLQLKSAARTEPDRPAKELVPLRWIKMLLLARKQKKLTQPMSVGEFYREVAKLGGFLGRKLDGEPGWITIWRGWQKLYLLVRGSELASELK